MIIVKAIIETDTDGKYGVYIDLYEKRLSYGIIGDGNTVQEAIADFENSYEEMKTYYAEINKTFQEAKFEYHYDIASFLQFYTTYFSLAGISRLSGINQAQLSHYLNGVRTPSKQTIRKIDTCIHDFANNLSRVQFV